jgi:hypothetical protein
VRGNQKIPSERKKTNDSNNEDCLVTSKTLD